MTLQTGEGTKDNSSQNVLEAHVVDSTPPARFPMSGLRLRSRVCTLLEIKQCKRCQGSRSLGSADA